MAKKTMRERFLYTQNLIKEMLDEWLTVTYLANELKVKRHTIDTFLEKKPWIYRVQTIKLIEKIENYWKLF